MLEAIEQEIEVAKAAALEDGIEGANTHFNQLRIQLIARARGIDGEHDYEEADESEEEPSEELDQAWLHAFWAKAAAMVLGLIALGLVSYFMAPGPTP